MSIKKSALFVAGSYKTGCDAGWECLSALREPLDLLLTFYFTSVLHFWDVALVAFVALANNEIMGILTTRKTRKNTKQLRIGCSSLKALSMLKIQRDYYFY